MTSQDPTLMGATAQTFWNEFGKRAKEMWRYPSGWALYFDDDRLVDLTVARKPLME
jgi:hypothetical protein